MVGEQADTNTDEAKTPKVLLRDRSSNFKKIPLTSY